MSETPSAPASAAVVPLDEKLNVLLSSSQFSVAAYLNLALEQQDSSLTRKKVLYY